MQLFVNIFGAKKFLCCACCSLRAASFFCRNNNNNKIYCNEPERSSYYFALLRFIFSVSTQYFIESKGGLPYWSFNFKIFSKLKLCTMLAYSTTVCGSNLSSDILKTNEIWTQYSFRQLPLSSLLAKTLVSQIQHVWCEKLACSPNWKACNDQ